MIAGVAVRAKGAGVNANGGLHSGLKCLCE